MALRPLRWWPALLLVPSGLLLSASLWVARQLARPSQSSSRIRVLASSATQAHVALRRTKTSDRPGIYSLRRSNGDLLHIGQPVVDLTTQKVVIRECPDATEELRGERVRWTGVWHETPSDLGLDFTETAVMGPLGLCPAWEITGLDTETWAIHIHGMGSSRASTLRAFPGVTELSSFTSLVVSYRGDGEGPRCSTGLGVPETDDVAAAMRYAESRGAKQFVLFGWSMGATIAMRLSNDADWSPKIRGLVLDSPVLDWRAVITSSVRRAGIPGFVGHLAYFLIASPFGRLAGHRTQIKTRDFPWLSPGYRQAHPVLVIHGAEDRSVPLALSRRFSRQQEAMTKLVVFPAGGHTTAWNTDPDRWAAQVGSWLCELKSEHSSR